MQGIMAERQSSEVNPDKSYSQDMEDQLSGRGLFWAACSSFFFSLCSLLAKKLDLPPAQLSWFGYLGVSVISAPLAYSHRGSLPKSRTCALIVRAILGVLYLMACFYSVELMPIGDASVLFYTAPVFTIVLAKIFLREPCSVSKAIVIVLIMVGVILVARPPLIFSHSEVTADYWRGAALALTASLTEAVGNVMLRELRAVHYAIVMFLHGSISLVILTFVVILQGQRFLDFSFSPQILLLSAFFAFDQLLITLALGVEHAGPVSLIQATDVIFGYAYQIIFFGEEINIFSAVGATLIGVMVVHLAREKSHKKKNKSVMALV